MDWLVPEYIVAHKAQPRVCLVLEEAIQERRREVLSFDGTQESHGSPVLMTVLECREGNLYVETLALRTYMAWIAVISKRTYARSHQDRSLIVSEQ